MSERFNDRRLLDHIGSMASAEAEASLHAVLETEAMAA
jgi:hypothetical protein